MSEFHDPDIQLYRRSMGLSYNEAAVRRAVNNGMAGERRSPQAPTHVWPEYDGTDDFGRIGAYNHRPVETVQRAEERVAREFPEYSPYELVARAGEVTTDILVDAEAVEDLLGTTEKEIAYLEQLFAESRLTMSDINPLLLTIVDSVNDAESDINAQLRKEHPNWTAAMDAWLEQDGRETSATEEDQPTALLGFYEDLTADVAAEKTTYEQELGMWLQAGQNEERQKELAEGLAYYEGMLEVCNHRRILALTGVEKDRLQRLYRLAA